MATEEHIVMKLTADAGSFLMVFDSAIAKMRKLGDSFDRFTKNTAVIKNAYSSMANGIVGNQKSMQTSFDNYYKSMQADLKPLSENTRKAMIDGIVQPSLTAEQAVDAMLQKNKELASFSTQLKQKHEAQGREVRDMSRSYRVFHMELLSTMFGAMMVNRAISNMLKPAFESVGIFEILRDTLEVTFLDTGLFVMEKFALPFMDWMMGLEPETQKALGGIALLGGGLGQLVEKGSSIGLFAFGIVSAAEKWGEYGPLIMGKMKGFAKLARIGISFYFLKEAFDEIREGNWTKAFASTLLAAAPWLVGINPIAAGAAFAIGVTLKYYSPEESEFQKAADDFTRMGKETISGYHPVAPDYGDVRPLPEGGTTPTGAPTPSPYGTMFDQGGGSTTIIVNERKFDTDVVKGNATIMRPGG